MSIRKYRTYKYTYRSRKFLICFMYGSVNEREGSLANEKHLYPKIKVPKC